MTHAETLCHAMPLVERYGDWNRHDGSVDDPHVLGFDHRIEADAVISEDGLANVEMCVDVVSFLFLRWDSAGLGLVVTD